MGLILFIFQVGNSDEKSMLNMNECGNTSWLPLRIPFYLRSLEILKVYLIKCISKMEHNFAFYIKLQAIATEPFNKLIQVCKN